MDTSNTHLNKHHLNVLVIIPAYNEQESIVSVVRSVIDHSLHGLRQLDHVEQLFLGEVVGVDVVLHCHGSSYGIGGPRHAVGSRISWRPLCDRHPAL